MMGPRQEAQPALFDRFVALARSSGMAAERAETPAALAEAPDRVIASGDPALIEVPVERGSETSPSTFLHPAPNG